MLLIIKISFKDLGDYIKEFTECLKHNIKNPIITRIIIFTDVENNNLPKSNKVTIINKKNYTHFESIEYSKKISNEGKIIYSNPFTKFGNDIFKLMNKDLRFSCVSSNSFYIFDRSTLLSNMETIEEIITTPKIKINLKVEEIKVIKVIKENTNIKPIKKKKITLKKSNNIKPPKVKAKKAKTKKVEEEKIVHVNGVVWENYQTWLKYNKTK